VCVCVYVLPPPPRTVSPVGSAVPVAVGSPARLQVGTGVAGRESAFPAERVRWRRRRRTITQLAKRSQATAGALSGLALIINRVQNKFMETNSPPAILLLEQCLKLHVSEGEQAAQDHLYGVLSGRAQVRTAPIHCILRGRCVLLGEPRG
jgi:hypothetical protein